MSSRWGRGEDDAKRTAVTVRHQPSGPERYQHCWLAASLLRRRCSSGGHGAVAGEPRAKASGGLEPFMVPLQVLVVGLHLAPPAVQRWEGGVGHHAT